MNQSSAVPITYFSDVLCIWAYAAEARVDEVKRQFGNRVSIDYRFFQVFGDTAQRIGVGWAGKGGYDGFNAHLKEVAAGFEHLEVHPDLWLWVRPASSASAHLFLKAVELCAADTEEGAPSALEAAAWRVRLAFFRECRDISRQDVLYEIADELSFAIEPIKQEIETGRAIAALCGDLEVKDRLKVDGSPTFVLNEGRQKLYGNVGYRVIEANIQELLRAPNRAMASWC